MSAPKVRITVNTKPLASAMRRYGRLRKMDSAQVVEMTGKKLLFDLYRQYRRFAATAAKIIAEAKARNWFTKIKGGAFGYAGNVIRTPKAVVDAELDKRGKHVGFLASTFLFRRWRVQRGGQRRLYTSPRGPKSRVFVDTDRTNPQVTIVSEVPGVIAMNQKHGLWNLAVVARVADMLTYCRRKEREAARAFGRV